MLLFRSEEHVDRWRNQRGIERGTVLPLELQWRLARTWYGDRLEPTWRRRTPSEAQELFTDLGLTGEFWLLPS